MTDDPPDITGGPEDVSRSDVIDIGHAPGQCDSVASVVAHDSLGLTRGAGRVEDVERVGRSHRYALDGLRTGDELTPVDIALPHRRDRLGSLKNHRCVRLVLGELKGSVEYRLVFHDATRLDATRRREHDLGSSIVDANRKLVRREPTKDH